MKKKIIILITTMIIIVLGIIIYNNFNHKRNFSKDYRIFNLENDKIAHKETFKIGESINLKVNTQEIKGILLSNTIIYSINAQEIVIIVPASCLTLLNRLKEEKNIKLEIIKSNINNNDINIKVNQILKKQLEELEKKP